MTRIAAFGAVIFACMQAHAGTTITMIDLPIPGSPRILDIRPDAPVVTMISVPGGTGVYGITTSAVPVTLGGVCGPASRAHALYTAKGIAVVLVDRADANLAGIVEYLWNRDGLPVWLGGGSASTPTVASLSVDVAPHIRGGVLLFAPIAIPIGAARAITRPTQVVYHVQDTIANSAAPQIYGNLTSAAAREIVEFDGGTPSSLCGGYHLLHGLEQAFVDAQAAFIAKHEGLVDPGAGPRAVEYFNASQGHYFMTADADEIAGLDGGAFGGALVRTGLGFNAFNAPSAGTVPVCRFFTTPGRFGTKGSHFYTANAAECDWLKGNPDWIYEKIAFHIQVPGAGTCGAGTAPVYRMFNRGQTGAPNHRFATDLALYEDFIATKGWDAEGIAFCAPL